MNYRDKATGDPVRAIRYGDEHGRWYPGAVREVASFMSGQPEHMLSEARMLDFVQPEGTWDPPGWADLRCWDGNAREAWHPLHLGRWVVATPDGLFSSMHDEDFTETYERAEVKDGADLHHQERHPVVQVVQAALLAVVLPAVGVEEQERDGRACARDAHSRRA